MPFSLTWLNWGYYVIKNFQKTGNKVFLSERFQPRAYPIKTEYVFLLSCVAQLKEHCKMDSIKYIISDCYLKMGKTKVKKKTLGFHFSKITK